MADGKVTIDTAIDSSGLKAGSKELEAAVKRLASNIDGIGANAKKSLEKQVTSFEKANQQYAAQEQKVQDLKAKIAELGNQKIPTEEFKAIGKQIDADTAKLNRLIEQQRLFEEIGGRTRSTTYKRRQLQIEELTNSIKYAKGEQEDLLSSGGAYKAPDTSKQTEAVLAEEEKLAAMNLKVQQSYNEVSASVDEYKSKNSMLSGIISRLSVINQKVTNSLKSLAKNLVKLAAGGIITGLAKISSGILGIHKSANKSTMSIGKMLKYLFGIRSLYTLFNKMRSALVDGFKNLVQYSGETNNAISSVMSALTQLKNSFATAFAPIVTTVAPYLVKFINLISECVTRVGMFVAALTGKNTFTRAVAVQEDYAASLDKSSKNTQKATKAAKNYLSPLDEIERYESNKDTSTPSSGKYTGPSPSDMFQEVPIDSSMKGLADKMKSIFSKIFKPFKEAWEKEGENTIDAAKFALNGLKTLAASVGKSLLEVWTNGTGTTMLSTMLKIAQNVLKIIGNISLRLSEAWNKNKVGTTIIQNIANAFQTVLSFIDRIADDTARWAANLNFYPLLESISNLTATFSPVLESIGNVLEWVYNTIVLPKLKWVIETGLPTVINLVADFLNFCTEHQTLIEAFGAALIGAFAAYKIAGLAMQIIGSITEIINMGRGIVNLVTGAGGILKAIKLIASTIGAGGVFAIAIGAAIAIGVLLYKNWDTICEAATKLKDWVVEKAEALATNVVNAITSLKEKTAKLWETIKTTASGVWTWMKNTASTIFNGIKNVISGIWNGIKQITGTVWSGIKTTASGIWEKLKTSASTIFEGIKTTISDVWDNLKETIPEAAKAIKEGIMDRFTEARDGVKDIFEKLADYVKTPINAAISLVNNGIGTMNNALGGLEKAFTFGPWEVPTPFGSKKIGFEAKFPKIKTIPYLAKGAVIPPKSEFLAVLGDQKSGRNLEAPEDLIRQIVREESGSGQGGNYRFTAQINRRTIFDEIIDEAKFRQNVNGRNPFELA